MFLSDTTIKKYLASGKIKISPPVKEKNIRPTGIRLYLGNEILIPEKNQTIDLEKPVKINYIKKKIPKQGYILKPNQFILASTHEKIMLIPNLVGQLDGRSTIARLGILVHCSSNIIDENHNEPRSIVFEIKNIGNFNIVLKSKMPLAMIAFSKLSESIKQKSQPQYKNQTTVMPPNLTFKTN